MHVRSTTSESIQQKTLYDLSRHGVTITPIAANTASTSPTSSVTSYNFPSSSFQLDNNDQITAATTALDLSQWATG